MLPLVLDSEMLPIIIERGNVKSFIIRLIILFLIIKPLIATPSRLPQYIFRQHAPIILSSLQLTLGC